MGAKLLGAFAGLTILASATTVLAEAPPVFVGGQFTRQHAVEDNAGHVLVPVRGVFEALGATVSYVAPRYVVVRKDGAVVAGLAIGRHSAIVSNVPHYLGAAPVRRGDRVYVPLRGIAEIAGADVRYSSHPRMVDIHVPNNELAPRLGARAAGDVPSDPDVPSWAYILVGVAVLAFVLELGRQLAVAAPHRSRRRAALFAVPSASRTPQLPYAPRASDNHRPGGLAD